MKKISCLFIFLLLSLTVAQAQFRFGVKGGLNIATAKFDFNDKETFNPDNITGFLIGPAFEFSLGRGGLGIDGAVLFAQKGFKSDDLTKSVKNSYLEVPVNLKFKLGLPLVNPYVAAGPYIDLRISGDKSMDFNYNEIKNQIKSKSFGAGLNFAIGAEVFGMLQLGINYNWGLTSNYETFEVGDPDSYKGKSMTWSFSAAAFF
ncbi:MAG: PorT family protein [Tannerella sp.]|jgi:hypothetical protein|nr:PorT family protein [Tannerella sp.]